jgi:23S rRNA (guanosine2251-2'-O)-methyltransferase
MNRKLKLWELDRVSEEDFRVQKKFPLIVILDDIRSLNNIGSFFRTADAFNVEKIYLCGITANPPHRDIQKTALGATETVDWEYRVSITELVEELKEQGVVVCVIEQAEKTVFLQHVGDLEGERFALVFGNEVDGVNQTVIDQSNHVIEIPQFGTKHSLNVSVCAGVVLWEFGKKYFGA